MMGQYLMRYLFKLKLLVMLLVSATACGAEFALSIADIASPVFSAQGIVLSLPDQGSADLQIARFKVQQHEFQKVRLRCAEFTLSSVQVVCHQGKLDALPGATLEWRYDFVTQHLQLSLKAGGGESWQVAGNLGGRTWQVAVQLHNAQAKRLAALWPAAMPLPDGHGNDAPPYNEARHASLPPQVGGGANASLREFIFTQGDLNGTLGVAGNAAGLQAVKADLRLSDLAFSDASGLHAAEKIAGNVSFAAQRKGAFWDWQGDVAWQSGEMFWQPWYLRGGHTLRASGRFDGKRVSVAQAVADLPEVGRVTFSADWDVAQSTLLAGAMRGDGLALEKLFDNYVKPMLDKGALADATVQGKADVAAKFGNGAVQSVQLGLHEVDIADASQRFALRGVNSEIAWQADAASTANVAFAGGILLGAPLGAGQWTVKLNGLDFAVPQAELAILDGRLTLRDLHIFRQADSWRWQFSGALSPISMAQFSVAAGWPKMRGKLAGRIPRVSYDGHSVSVEGALLFDVFDGSVVATQLKLSDAFGRVPRLSGNLAMRNLDLDLLTRTFSFGNMQGRIDADVNDLQLQDWQPLRFDARVYSSAGKYPKKISQKAVQNISALGGAGAAAAIQRSFLGFFENFGYDRIGWRCVLRNGVCTMGGIDEANQGTYTLVHGGGIPAISVMGYNRTVSWGDLTTRLKRVTQGNAAPIIK